MMKRTIGGALVIGVALLLVSSAMLLSGCAGSGYKEVPQYTIEQFTNTRSLGGASFSQDESRILYHSDQTGNYNLFTVPVEGGDPTQVTDAENDSRFAGTFFPTDDRILFHGDQGGNELYHIFLREEDGEVTDLTPWEKARSLFRGWERSDEAFYFVSNRRDPRAMDLYRTDLNTLKSEMHFQNDDALSLGDISGDGRYVTLVEQVTNANTRLFLVDLEDGERIEIMPHEVDAVVSPMTFHPTDPWLYFGTNLDHEFNYVMRYHLETGESEVVHKVDWDVMGISFSHNGRYRAISINEDARTKLEVMDTETGRPVHIENLPAGNITSVGFSRSEDRMAFYLSDSRHPADLFVFEIRDNEWRRLTNASNPEIDPENLVTAEVRRFESFDGVEIPGVFYKPHQIKPGEKAPAVVWVHGGPGGQSRIGYSAVIQYLVNHGYVVYAINNRGSSGYGKTFYHLDDLKHGEDDLDDVVESKKWLADMEFVDGERIGIVGGSYGGYMTLAALTFRPEVFTAGVDLFGISNWVRTLESIPPWWEAQRIALYKEIGHPEKHREQLRAKSPLFHADQIVRPLMVLQGANDPRVLKVESDEIVEAVKANGVPVEYIVFDDEGHGFRNQDNQIRGYKAMLNFLDRYVKHAGEEVMDEAEEAVADTAAA